MTDDSDDQSPEWDDWRVLDRRSLLAASGVGVGIALGGCLGDDEDDDDDEEPEDDDPGEEEEDDPTDPDDDDDDDDEEEDEEEDLPDPTDTETALIEPETLHEWQEAGLVNKEDVDGTHRVVILRVDDWYVDADQEAEIQSFDEGHIPGAVPIEAGDIHAMRLEGLAEAAPLVATGDQMDDVMEKAGVCPETTIVVSGSSPLRTARVYWTLRYWGFPRERVKILNGGYHAYGEAYDLEEGEFDPAVTADADFSVEANEELNNDLRLGIAQMIQRVDNLNEGESDDVILENRTHPQPDIMISNAIWDDATATHGHDHYRGMYDDTAEWYDADEIEDYYDDLGVGPDDTVITYCGSGYRATKSFFALDGILGWDDVMVYDGSYSRQWVQYAGDDVPDEWRVDMHDRTDGDEEWHDIEIAVDEIPELESPEANQVEAADIEYMGGDADEEDDENGANGDWGC